MSYQTQVNKVELFLNGDNDYVARLKDNHDFYAVGSTQDAAIGSLVRSFPDIFNMEEVTPPDPPEPRPAKQWRDSYHREY